MTLQALQARALEVRALYEQLETKRHGRSWTTGELMLGFAGDVGDLAKLIQGHEGVRRIDDLESKLGHELADCLWSLLVLAERCNVDLESAFEATMDELSTHVSNRLAEEG